MTALIAAEVADPRRGGRPGRHLLLHARRPAGAAVVDPDRLRRRHGRDRRRPGRRGAPDGARGLPGPPAPARRAGPRPARRLRPRRRRRADRRNWLMLHAVGIDASVFDAIAVAHRGRACSASYHRPDRRRGRSGRSSSGRRASSAPQPRGLMLTATGTIGGVLFAAWAGLDRLHSSRQVAAGRRDHAATVALHDAIARLPQTRRRIIENAYFGGLSSVHISRTLGLPSAPASPTRRARASGSRSP